MNENLPPLPSSDDLSPEACAVIQLYMAVLNDLTSDQVRVIAEHAARCEHCAQVHQELTYTTSLVASLPITVPSSRVDDAVMAAIAARARTPHQRISEPLQPVALSALKRRTSPRPTRRIAILAAVAALIIAVVASGGFLLSSLLQPAFALPQNLTWSGYVLYHIQTVSASSGESYQVTTYYDLGTGMMNVEAQIDGAMDIVLVGDVHDMVGKDMMHHVAEKNPDSWHPDESIFQLDTLRHDLASGRATYLGKDHFQGQDVYRIRTASGPILLLDMHYLPVNVLGNANAANNAHPVYNTLKMLPSAAVKESTWDMSIPPEFAMGSIPTRP